MSELTGPEQARALGKRLVEEGKRAWLFLDYDGTLAEFAPTPDTILPDADLIQLLTDLAQYPEKLRIVIMSGRRFSHIQELLPVPGILEAGTYGIEFETWEGEQMQLLDFETERPFLDQVKKQWAQIVGKQPGFYIEDKGYSLALHARRAPEKAAHLVLAEAASSAKEIVERGTFRMLGGYKFLEVAPTIADKGQSVSTLLKRFPWPNAELFYLGDDDKDEEAFKVIIKQGGVAIVVSAEPRPSLAQYRLHGPAKVRDWLKTLQETLAAGLKPQVD